MTAKTKPEAEAKLFDIFKSEGGQLLVLARYMQILSDDLCKKLHGKAINIYHSFLPSFKGAKPYFQAHDRGVKFQIRLRSMPSWNHRSFNGHQSRSYLLLDMTFVVDQSQEVSISRHKMAIEHLLA